MSKSRNDHQIKSPWHAIVTCSIGNIGLEEHKSLDVFSTEASSAVRARVTNYSYSFWWRYVRPNTNKTIRTIIWHRSEYESNIRYIPSTDHIGGDSMVSLQSIMKPRSRTLSNGVMIWLLIWSGDTLSFASCWRVPSQMNSFHFQPVRWHSSVNVRDTSQQATGSRRLIGCGAADVG